MDTTLHGRIAYVLAKDIENKYGISINKRSFILGSMLPDINPILRFKSHNKNRIQDEVYDWLLELFKHKGAMDERFYKKLGIILHFIADFFCTPHNSKFKGNLIEHEIYEKVQDFKWGFKLSSILEEIDEKDLCPILDYEDLIDYINDLHTFYMRNNVDNRQDLFYAIKCSRIICHSIIESKSFVKKKEELQVVNL